MTKLDAWLGQHPPHVTWVKDLIPYAIPAEAPVIAAVAAAATAVTGQPLTAALMPAWADAANLAHHGHTPAVLLGPGLAGKAHSDDEAVRLADLVTAAKIVAVYLVQRLRRDRAGD